MIDYKDIKNTYTLSTERHDTKISVTQIIEDEDDSIYAMGLLFKQFLLAMTYSEETIDRILRLEEIDG